ncbi:hypothetical protein [Solirubrum puertoriconensis]|uniref:Uncharacterized protein n=1 Tax=Solirubrum puertoriconensis TaxID=1751427 RepID=A0A9X0L4A5_SOLP1|nr:hypothetical protein [Solirubrum puertoriconensis]KUG07404.1 hypothetical protein ASU33_13710 [Solirubrum puertoriconensis]
MNRMEERLAKAAAYEREEARRELEAKADLIAAFKEHCAQYDVILTDEHFSYQDRIGVVATYPNLVHLICPELPRDKDGLTSYGELRSLYKCHPFAAGYFFGEKFVLMAHTYFRRGYLGVTNWAPNFLGYFGATDDPAIVSKLALDNDRVRVNVDTSAYLELDAWYGPKFNPDILQMADGIVRHIPPAWMSENRIQWYFNGVYALDVKWSTAGNIKTFQAEEFRTIDVTVDLDGETYFPARYLHAEFDLERNYFRHFDGALHLYNFDEYCERRDSDFNYNAKHNKQIKSGSQKLFRLDGAFGVELWMELTSQFLTGNPLIHEYFTGRMPESYDRILEALKNIPEGED